MIIREAAAQGSADLKYAGISSPSLDASLLLAHVLKINRTLLVARGTEKLSEKECAAYCRLIERRAGGECVAYITGKKEFRGLEFTVNKSVLVPRPDTETLVEAALDIIKEKTLCNSLDLCTGSGAVAIALKNERPDMEVFAADISEEALETAKQNAANLLPGRQIRFYQGDLFDALPSSNSSFDLIVSNPPYIPSDEIQTLSAEVQNEPRLALDGGKDGLEIIKRIIEDAPNYLLYGGFLLLESDPRQMDEILGLLDKRGFKSIQLFKDLCGLNRVIGGAFEK